jgi:hypothetical protein
LKDSGILNTVNEKMLADDMRTPEILQAQNEVKKKETEDELLAKMKKEVELLR